MTRCPQSRPVVRLGPNHNPWWGYAGAQTQKTSLESLYGQDPGDGKKHSSLPPEWHQTLGSRAENPDVENIQRNPKPTPPIRGCPRHTILTQKPVLLPASHPRVKSREPHPGSVDRACHHLAPNPSPSFCLSTSVSIPGASCPPGLCLQNHNTALVLLSRGNCQSRWPKPSRLGENYKAPEFTPMS